MTAAPWTLSQIEDELDKLADDLPLPPPPPSEDEDLPPPTAPLPAPPDVDEAIYSKIVVKPAYSREEREQQAVKHFSDKYRRPAAVAPRPPPVAALVAPPCPVVDDNADPPLTDAEIQQAELFYRSHKSDVHVCACVARLYEGAGSRGDAVELWKYVKTGIPVWVAERSRQRLSLVLSERGTGFPLWRQTLTHLSDYRSLRPAFHTLHTSADHGRLAALSFADSASANHFVQTLAALTAGDDSILSLSKRRKQPAKKYKPPNKADISSPCCFVHVTKLESVDRPTAPGSPLLPPGSLS